MLAGPVSLSGRYAALGRLAADGLRQVVEDVANAGGVEGRRSHADSSAGVAR